MGWKFVGSVVALAACLHGGPAPAASAAYKIVTASERGTYIQIGRDLAKFVAPEADIDLEVLPTIEGVRAGRDEVLEAALRAVLGSERPESEIRAIARDALGRKG